MSPQLLAAEAFLVMKPQRIRWKGWPESGDCVRHFGNTWTVPSQICQWLFLRFITVGESMKQESQSADYVGWTRRSALQPRPHSTCRTAWGRSLLDSGGPPGTGGRPGRAARLPRELAFTRPHRRTSRRPRHQEVNLRRASTQHWENDQGHELALPPGSFWRERGRPSTSIDSSDNCGVKENRTANVTRGRRMLPRGTPRPRPGSRVTCARSPAGLSLSLPAAGVLRYFARQPFRLVEMQRWPSRFSRNKQTNKQSPNNNNDENQH